MNIVAELTAGAAIGIAGHSRGRRGVCEAGKEDEPHAYRYEASFRQASPLLFLYFISPGGYCTSHKAADNNSVVQLNTWVTPRVNPRAVELGRDKKTGISG